MIAIATGRMPVAAYFAIDEIRNFVSYLICLNGSLVIDCMKDHIVCENKVFFSEIKDVYNFVSENKYNIVFIDYNNVICNKKTKDNVVEDYIKRTKSNRVYMRNIDDNFSFHKAFIYSDKVLKKYSYNSPFFDYEINNEINFLKNNRINCKITKHGYTEFTSIGVDKSIGVIAVLEYSNYIFKDVVAFGDSINDIELMKFSNLSISMSNGWDELHEFSDIVSSNDNYIGVSKGIKAFL